MKLCALFLCICECLNPPPIKFNFCNFLLFLLPGIGLGLNWDCQDMTETYLERITTFVWGFSDNIYTGQFFLKYSQEGKMMMGKIRLRNINISYLDFIITGELGTKTKVGFSLSTLKIGILDDLCLCCDIEREMGDNS